MSVPLPGRSQFTPSVGADVVDFDTLPKRHGHVHSVDRNRGTFHVLFSDGEMVEFEMLPKTPENE